LTHERLSAPFRNEVFAPGSDYDRFLLASISRSSDYALISTTLDRIVLTWNGGATHIFGYSAEEMIGQSFLCVVPKESEAEAIATLNNLNLDETRRFEAARLKKNGELIRVFVSMSPIKDDSGKVIGVSHIESEVSREYETQSRLAAIVESSDDAIISKNLDGIITSWNRAACRLFDYTSEEMIGQSILKIIPKELHPEEAQILEKLRSGERLDHCETRRIRKDGQIVEVSLTISPVKDGGGMIIGSSKIARDISGRKNMERLLIQSEKLAATGRMAATIAHEINNPLDALLNLVYLAKKSVDGNSKALPYLITAERELERVGHIARKAMGYYRDPGLPSDVSLEQLIEEVLAVYHPKLLTANIAIDCEFGHHRPITGSKDELMQVFSNLITNSIDAMPEGGVLTIQTRAVATEGVETLVLDRGTGIAPGNLEKVFEPFFTTKGELGTGIGLWVARELVEKHRGRISLQSSTKSPGHGTTVTVFIPFKP
jgi:PAS domain S-box-containing protein